MDLRKQQESLEDRLEACRPDSPDISQEELREAASALASDADLAQRFDLQQRSDARVSQAMRQVAAPAGLADRLLARLAQADAVPTTTDEETAAPLALDGEFTAAELAARESLAHESLPAAPAEPTVEPAKSESPRDPSRRKLVYAVSALAASLLLGMVGYQWWLGPDLTVTPKEFQDQAIRWRESVKSDRWKADQTSLASLVQEYPLRHMVGNLSGYQTIDPKLSDASEQIVYDFSSPRGKAYLFVAKTRYTSSMLSADGFPPSQSAALSAGWRMAAWRDGPLLYVLLHQGGPHQYNQLVDSPSAIAMVEPAQERLLALARPESHVGLAATRRSVLANR